MCTLKALPAIIIIAVNMSNALIMLREFVNTILFANRNIPENKINWVREVVSNTMKIKNNIAIAISITLKIFMLNREENKGF